MVSPVMTKVSGLLGALLARCQLSEGDGLSLFKLRLSVSNTDDGEAEDEVRFLGIVSQGRGVW